ncbi:class I adenylate-forming enzyme family protein [Dermatobacter hominis]|uniref:class I adenylate-forming enzyme family protein n=1 Tax=Dermatobacter hominis TaxID=2884263 RepID=UPI001D11A72A|nr:class I adenylate-forming enzyme family protein [Dermatobacter hominis]UDY38065.1 acyl--CoA ligase [Dermatobacter hominis]
MRFLKRAGLALRHHVTLSDLADRWVDLHGDRLMVTEEGVTPPQPVRGGAARGRVEGNTRALTYGQAADLVARWSAVIAARTEPGDTVVIATPNGIDQFLLCLAAARAGRVPAPVNPQMRPAEVDHVIADSGASLVVRGATEMMSGPGSRSTPKPPAEPSPDDVAALFYTSGTTGTPKGAELTHRALLGGLAPMAAFPSWLRNDELVLSLPVAHIMGFVSVLGPTLAGVPMYFLRQFHAERVLDVIEERRSSAFMGVPATYRLLDQAGAEYRDLTCVRLWMTGADVMPAPLARRFKSYGASMTLPFVGPVGEAAFFEGYGMVETGGGVVAKVSPPMLPVGLGDSLGLTLPGWKVRVADQHDRPVPSGSVGELQIKGPGVLRGYHGDAAASSDAMTEDGWLRTGDLVRSGPFGLMSFQGRSKNVIKSGGYSVYSIEVEADLEEHPDVVEAGVVGIDDAKLGQVPVAAVKLRDGAKVTPDKLIAWSRGRMARYKAPRQVVVVDDLPRTGTRKIRRDQLVSLFDPAADPTAEATVAGRTAASNGSDPSIGKDPSGSAPAPKG